MHRLPLSVICCALLSMPAFAAAPRPFWESKPISAQAIAGDPVLAGYQTFDLKVELTGRQFAYGQLWMTLPSGALYNHPFGTNLLPPPGVISAFPATECDTFVTVPPPATCLARDALTITGIPILSGNMVDVSMFSQNLSGPTQPITGIFLIGRFTVPIGVTPVVLADSRVVSIPGLLSAAIPQVPEPSGAGLLILAAHGLRRRAVAR